MCFPCRQCLLGRGHRFDPYCRSSVEVLKSSLAGCATTKHPRVSKFCMPNSSRKTIITDHAPRVPLGAEHCSFALERLLL